MKLQDYLHYYLGCKVIGYPYGGQSIKAEEGTLVGVNLHVADVKFGKWQSIATLGFDKIKPILRKLEDITKEEESELDAIKGNKVIYRSEPSIEIKYDTPETFHWMLKKQFDLFDLIENGLAIDSKTLTT